jgi:hypothetical protein
MERHHFFSSISAIGAVATAALLTASGPAASADLGSCAAPVSAPSQWTSTFTPYGWLPWITGDTVVEGRKFDVDVTPWEIIEHLDDVDFMWMSNMEARRGPLGLFSDIVYAKFSGSKFILKSKSFSPHVSGSVGAALDAEYEFAIVEAGGAYEVAKWGAGATAFDLLAGARYWHQETDVAVDATLTTNLAGLTISGNRAIASSGSVDWVDPFIGARVRHQLAPGEELMLRGDVGGFDAGSEFSWQLIGTYNWKLCTASGYLIDGYLGYRALSVDYTQGSGVSRFEYDVLYQGPVSGLTIHF